MSLRDFLPEVILPGSIELEHRLHPFKPASSAPKFGEDNFLKFRKKQKERELKVKFYEQKKKSKVRCVRDAETGTEIKLTKVVWSCEEGLLSNGN